MMANDMQVSGIRHVDLLASSVLLPSKPAYQPTVAPHLEINAPGVPPASLNQGLRSSLSRVHVLF